MKSLLHSLFSPWTWRMAWRDTRTSRGRLFLFAISIVLGVAGLAANGSLGKNLEQAVAEQSKTLLGADLSLSSRRPFTAEEENFLKDLGGEQSRETSFSSMIYFPAGGGTRLVSARALSGGFPFYGHLETEPAAAVAEFRQGRGALVEQDLLFQFGAKVGDNIRLGTLTIPVVGALRKVPGEIAALATVSPRVYFPMDDLPKTGLLGPGSLAQYKVYFQFPAQTNIAQLVTRITPQLDQYRLDSDTVEKRQSNLGHARDNFYNFLNLSGLAVLLLGGVGVGGGIHGHVKQKLSTVAVLRCLGGSIGPVFAVYVAQAIVLGLVGAALGASIGLVVPSVLPRLLGDFMPVTVNFHPAWFALVRAAAVGFVVCLLFCFLPLLAVRRVSPWVALRVSFEPAARPDPLRRVIIALLAAIVLGFALTQGPHWLTGLAFVGGIAAVFLLLAATARGLTVMLARKLTALNLPFVVRQGLSNLHRPDNRTQLLILSLGLGAFLLVGIFLIQHTLMSDLIVPGEGNANAVLFDIQADQKEAAAKLIRSLGLPVLDELPRSSPCASVRSRAAPSNPSSPAATPTPRPPGRLRREYRSTYTDHLRDAEKIIAGQWIGSVKLPPTTLPPPSPSKKVSPKTCTSRSATKSSSTCRASPCRPSSPACAKSTGGAPSRIFSCSSRAVSSKTPPP